MPKWIAARGEYEAEDTTEGPFGVHDREREERFRTALLNELSNIADALKTIERQKSA